MSKLTYRIKKKELREILTETKKYDKGAYQVVVLGISTGLRASDLINLKYSDLYAFDGTPHKYIYFKEQKTKKFANTCAHGFNKNLYIFTRKI